MKEDVDWDEICLQYTPSPKEKRERIQGHKRTFFSLVTWTVVGIAEAGENKCCRKKDSLIKKVFIVDSERPLYQGIGSKIANCIIYLSLNV